MTDTNLNVVTNEFNIPLPPEKPADPPPPTLEDVMKALAKVEDDPPPADPPAAPPAAPPAKPAEPPADPPKPSTKEEIDALLNALEDESDGVRNAIKAALEKGANATEMLTRLMAERQADIDARESVGAEEQLVAETAELGKMYPGFTEADLKATLEHLAKLPPALAEELTLEEVAARALGRDTLEARRTAPPAPGGDAPSDRRTPDAATIIGDSTPGPGAAPKPFDAGTGGDFMDIANHVTKNFGSTLVTRTP